MAEAAKISASPLVLAQMFRTAQLPCGSDEDKGVGNLTLSGGIFARESPAARLNRALDKQRSMWGRRAAAERLADLPRR
jgi:hypothetical protein